MTAVSGYATFRTRIAFMQWRGQDPDHWSPASLENLIRAVDGQPLDLKGRAAMRDKAAEAWMMLDRLLKALKGPLAAAADWGLWLNGACDVLAGFALSCEADPLALEAAEKTFAVMRASAESHGSTAAWEKAAASALLVFRRYASAAASNWEAAKRLEDAGRTDAHFLRCSALAWECWRRQE